jgi:glycosyltransferase involved in cell wall biosynthesis
VAGRSSAEGRPFTVGWLGSPSTTRYVRLLANVFARLAASGPLRVVVVGGTPVTMPGVQVEQRPWSKDTEAGDIAGFDVGVMPLEDSPWERGKCGYKLIQYMAGGVPVVASPVGVNAELAVPEVTGLLASSDDEWVAALGRLRDDPALRRRLGEAGRALVERRYSLDVATPRLAKVLTDLVPSRASVL